MPTPTASTQIEMWVLAVPAMMPAAKSRESPVMNGITMPTNSAVPTKTRAHTAT